jgi:DNA polymerase III alpha subunit
MPIKTGFSFNTAAGTLDEIASRLVEIGWSTGPICDRGGTHGHVRWTKTCSRFCLRPVYGVELAVSADPDAEHPSTDHWSFIAKDSMRPLNDLIFAATSRGTGEPMVSIDDAQRSGLIMIAHERAQIDEIDWSTVFFGLSPGTPKWLWGKAKALGARALVVPRNLYPREADLEFYRVTLGRRSSTQTYPQWILSDEELISNLRWMANENELAEAIFLRIKTLEQSTATLQKAELLKPERIKSLRDMCLDGAIKLGIDLNDSIYQERLDRELNLIEQKNFEDYFYLLAEMVNWAKERMVVGPARGSSCGSLACYLLGITAIDPLRHDLIFERFIDVTRTDLPDVDLDFSEAKRDLVFEHIEQLYPGRVGRLGNVAMFGIKSALNQIGLNLRIPQSITDAVAETAIKRAMGDSRRNSTMEDTLHDTDAGKRMMSEYPEAGIITRLDGHPHNASRHAAGIVATAGPIRSIVAVDARTGTAMCDKYDAESLNLLKVDVLGLSQLTVFERAMELIGVEPISGWHEKIPLDDPKVFEVLNQRKFCGIFQFEGNAMRSLSDQIHFETIDDIIATTALVRPGPMASGNTDRWVARRAGKPVEYPHPILEPYLRDTLGVVIYQETILKIGREIGDLSWEDVTKLRQAMSKSLGTEFFYRYGEKWVIGAVKRGIPEDIAKKFFDDMCQFGAWAFNKAHSVSYAYVSYWSAWWKAHHPIEYACAVLDSQGDPAKQIALLRELRKEGIDYVPVDPQRSEERWTPAKDERGKPLLLGPLSNIIGVGPSNRRLIIAARNGGKPLTPSLAEKVREPKTMIDTLYPIEDWLEKTYPNGELARRMNVRTKPVPINTIDAGRRDLMIIGTPVKLMPKDENEPVKRANRKRLGKPEYVNPSAALVLFIKDDTGDILAKINAEKFVEFGRKVVERGKLDKAIYAFKGQIDRRIRMLWVDRVRYLGDLGDHRGADNEQGRQPAEVVSQQPA